MNIAQGHSSRAHSPQADHTAAHPAAALARHLDAILAPLVLLVAARFRILGDLTLPVWTRLSRARQRIAALLGHLAAGRLPLPRAPLPASPGAARKGGPPPAYIPRRRAWLVHALGHEAAAYASQLEAALRDPAAPAIIAASPGTARTLRRLCRLLGVAAPQFLAPPPTPRPLAPPPLPRPAPQPLRVPAAAPHAAPPVPLARPPRPLRAAPILPAFRLS